MYSFWFLSIFGSGGGGGGNVLMSCSFRELKFGLMLFVVYKMFIILIFDLVNILFKKFFFFCVFNDFSIL